MYHGISYEIKKHQYDGTGVFHTVGLGPYVKIYSLELSQRVNKLC